MARTTARLRLLAVSGLAAIAVTACSATPPPAPTVKVDRGAVATSVSASGTLAAAGEQNLGFPDRGKLAEVNVKVGDKVKAGQQLARLDDFALRQSLQQANAKVAQQRASLDKIMNGNPVEAADATLKQAQSILEATQQQVNATSEADNSAVDRAYAQLDFDRDALSRAESKLNDDRSTCDNAPTATPTPTGSTGTSTSTSTDPACGRIAADESAVDTAKRTVLASESAVETAEQKRNTDAAAGKLSIENATQSVVNAQNSSNTAVTDRPANIANQQALVRDTQAAAALAQRNLDNAVLKAPVAGVVSAVNGAVGEYVGAAAGTTAQAPGSSARRPADAAAATGTSASSAVVVLNNIDTFQLVVPFAEADAAQIAPGQRVDITVDAVPGLTKPGTVLAVAPSGNTISGIVNYYATIVLNESDPVLRNGQTAEAAVLIKAVEKALRVPTSAVRTDSGRTVVDVPGQNGTKNSTAFVAGLAGGDFTEVVSGLQEGQDVLLPQAKVTAQPQGGPPR